MIVQLGNAVPCPHQKPNLISEHLLMKSPDDCLHWLSQAMLVSHYLRPLQNVNPACSLRKPESTKICSPFFSQRFPYSTAISMLTLRLLCVWHVQVYLQFCGMLQEQAILRSWTWTSLVTVICPLDPQCWA